MQIDLFCPVENRGVTVKTNSKSGEPYALFKLFNVSNEVICAVSFTVHMFDAYGTELGSMPVELTELSAAPKAFFAENKAVSLAEYPGAKHLTVDVTHVTFENEECYEKGEHITEVQITEPDDEEKLRLIAAAGEDAYCYAKNEAEYWVCVCGRPNLHESDFCVRCTRAKADVLARFSSHEALNKTLAVQEEARRLAEEEAQKRAEEEKALKRAECKKKFIKGSKIAAIVIAAALVLWGIFSLVMLLLGNGAVKNEEYMKAYKYYSMVSGKKADAISEEVRGNSVSNLQQLGLMTADDENIYYTNANYEIFKQNKETGETMRLGENPGVYLNIADGWLYYLDAMTAQSMYRTKVDGSVTETVYELKESMYTSMHLIGNEIFFTAQEPVEMTPEMQEEMALQGQTAPTTQYRLYRLKVGAKKAKLVSNEDITTFSYYKGKIYYLNQADSMAVYCMDKNGKNATKIIGGPVYTVLPHNDMLYYLDGSPNPETGEAKLSVEIADLNGAYQKNAVENRMIFLMGADGEDLYYIAVTEESWQFIQNQNGTETVLAEDVQLFNRADGYMLQVDSMGGFYKTTYDKSGMEEIVIEVPEAPAENAEAPETAPETTPAE